MLEREKVEVKVKIVNVVASAALGQKVNLNSIIRSFSSAGYPSKQFPGIVLRLRKPKTAFLIFRTGKIVCVGGRTENEAYEAIEHFLHSLVKRQIIVSKRPKFRVNNIVASVNLGRPVDLTSISTWPKTIYEPEQFPALIYRMEHTNIVFLIFSSGRVICLGAKNEDELESAIQKLFQKLNLSGAFESLPLNKIETGERESFIKSASFHKLKLRDFAFSDSLGRACIHVDGLWCKNRLCSGPPCKIVNHILRKVINGVYGCWGFHWQEGWYTEEVKQAQRKFFD